MFDNPNKELQRLQERLLEAEEEQEQPQTPTSRVSPSPVPKERILPLPDEADEKPPAKTQDNRTKIALLVAALLLEISALLGVIAWWLLWR